MNRTMNDDDMEQPTVPMREDDGGYKLQKGANGDEEEVSVQPRNHQKKYLWTTVIIACIISVGGLMGMLLFKKKDSLDSIEVNNGTFGGINAVNRNNNASPIQINQEENNTPSIAQSNNEDQKETEDMKTVMNDMIVSIEMEKEEEIEEDLVSSSSATTDPPVATDAGSDAFGYGSDIPLVNQATVLTNATTTTPQNNWTTPLNATYYNLTDSVQNHSTATPMPSIDPILIPAFSNPAPTKNSPMSNSDKIEIALSELGYEKFLANETIEIESVLHPNSTSIQTAPDNSAGHHLPLPCNSNLTSSNCSTKLSSLVATAVDNTTLTIPCGVCVQSDYTDGETIVLPKGLRIEGLLLFPSTSNVTIRTTHVFVLGKLSIPQPPIQVRIRLFGNDDAIFQPHEHNSLKSSCDAVDGCNFGSKAIAVVGGQVDIRAYNNDCPAWEKLQDVGTSGQPLMGTTDHYGKNILRNGNFESSGDGDEKTKGWFGYGNPIGTTSPGYVGSGHAVVASGRTEWTHGVAQSITTPLKRFRQGQEWRIQAKVKLTDPTGKGVNCNPSRHFDCPTIRIFYETVDGEHVFREYQNDESMVWKTTEWNELDVHFFIDAKNIQTFHVIICGGRQGTLLVVDDVSLRERDNGSLMVNQLKVSSEAAACWSPGTELVLTSHTRFDEDRQLATVLSSDKETGIITLSDMIHKPLTAIKHGDFAVEVASLTRSVIFDAEDDNPDDLIGGHLIIYFTPLKQHVEGVEMRNFGQQGNLGRYPFHLHFCDNIAGSVVKKNVVRDSNQRCYVIHQTNQVLIEDNVALDARGHCYFLEDGTEVSNVFRHNLGLGVTKADRLLSALSGRIETDDQPSIFWISNPSNFFYSNVAAGGSHLGYWFETPKERATLNLGAFRDNEAHSMRSFGFTTYPPGWTPTAEAVIANLKVYRNVGSGAFLHVTRRLTFLGGIVADNGLSGIYILNGDDINFIGTEIIGRSSSDVDIPLNCKAGREISGMLLHPTKLQEFDFSGTIRGTSLVDVAFQNWSQEKTGCKAVSPMNFTQSLSHVLTPTFDSPHYFYNVTFGNDLNQANRADSKGIEAVSTGRSAVQACNIRDIFGIDDVSLEIVEDPSASFSPTAKPGFLISPKLSALVSNPCYSFQESCLNFCVGACMRTIRFLTNAAFPGDIEMVVAPATGTGSNTVRVERKLRNGMNSNALIDGVYGVSLPAGKFNIWFQDESGNLVYPSYVIPTFEAPPLCANHVRPHDIQILTPPGIPSGSMCNDLIVNGNFDQGIEGWQEIAGAGLQWNPLFGTEASQGALQTTSRRVVNSVISQWLNVKCANELDIFELKFSYKLLNNFQDRAKNAVLTFYHFDTRTGKFRQSILPIPLVHEGGPSLRNGYRIVSARWIVTREQATADKIRFTPITVSQPTTQFIVDAISFRKASLA